MTPAEIAEQRCRRMGPASRLVFLKAFAAARADVATGADTETTWRHLNARTNSWAAGLAGYVEGLASTRPMVPRPQPWRHDRSGQRTGVAS